MFSRLALNHTHQRKQLFKGLGIKCLGAFIKCSGTFAVTLALALPSQAADLPLPDLGSAGSGVITPAQEYELGQKWLRIYRAQVPTTNDPFVLSYTEKLIYGISRYSDLTDSRLSILVVENPSLNAFAVPGGVVGIHTGLFNYAENEQQFSSVIAHELAHLSQRHYARKVEEQQQNTMITLAALLASVIVAATTDGDAGIAAISATQAAAIDAQLRFSRGMEQEADRIGMETLVRAGMDPYAMPAMFEQILKSTRYSRRPPEFLLTHPVTESRISDSRNRAQQYPKKFYEKSTEYELVKIRVSLNNTNNYGEDVRRFENELRGNRFSKLAAQYGLVLSLTRAGKTERALTLAEELVAAEPENIYFTVARADVYAEKGDFETAVKALQEKLKTHPNHHALNVRLAEVLMKAGRYNECADLLNRHVQRRPNDDYVWYLLAEVQGLTGNILQVHLARAEYFALNGIFSKSEIQLRHALKRVKDDEHQKAKIEERLKEVRQLERETLL